MALHIPYNQHSLHGAAVYRSYEFAPSHSASEEPLIPRPEIFDQLSKPAAQDTGLLPIRIPNVSECAVHLKLLEALYELRQKVMNSKALDAALDIKPEPRTVWRGRRGRRRQVKIQDSTFVRRREGKWPIYVKFAVLRFLHWAKKIDNALHQAKLTGEEKEIGVPPLGKCRPCIHEWTERLIRHRYTVGLAFMPFEPARLQPPQQPAQLQAYP